MTVAWFIEEVVKQVITGAEKAGAGKPECIHMKIAVNDHGQVCCPHEEAHNTIEVSVKT